MRGFAGRVIGAVIFAILLVVGLAIYQRIQFPNAEPVVSIQRTQDANAPWRKKLEEYGRQQARRMASADGTLQDDGEYQTRSAVQDFSSFALTGFCVALAKQAERIKPDIGKFDSALLDWKKEHTQNGSLFHCLAQTRAGWMQLAGKIQCGDYLNSSCIRLYAIVTTGGPVWTDDELLKEVMKNIK